MASDERKPEADSGELAAFVASTLRAISAGIHEAQGSARIRSAHGTGEFAFSAPEQVEFDIAVTAKKASSAKGGFKVEVFSIGANLGGEETGERSSISRIKFMIPTKFKTSEAASVLGDRYEELDD
tara:strand:- start:105 stop:482 length:378 start_codon:yes stop_codon:yes gene_type:complete